MADEKEMKAEAPTKISLVIPCYNESSRIDQMLNGVKDFSQQNKFPFEWIVVNDGSSDDTVQKIEINTFYQTEKQNGRAQIISLTKNSGKGFALKAGVMTANGSHILTLDADMSSRPTEINQWLAKHQGKFPASTILIGSREHKDSKITELPMRRRLGRVFNFFVRMLTPLSQHDTQCGFKLYPSAIAKQLFGNLKNGGWAHDTELLVNARLHNVHIEEMPLTWKAMDGSKINPAIDSFKMFFQVLMMSLRIKFQWFFVEPIREFKNGAPAKDSLFRLLFALLAVVLLCMMVFLSFDYGMTGDELVQKLYGEKVLNFYTTFGKDRSFMDIKIGFKNNLFYYGGLYDMICAAANRYIGHLDEYEMRHVINCIFGFLAMLFCGLLAKRLGSWRTGFIALLLVACWPQFFGQSMNNPKDIPFAFSYVFGIYYLMLLVQQLPSPNKKTLVMTTIGLALAINMRVGGLILIGMLFAFVIGYYILSKDFRLQLKTQKGAQGRLMKYLFFISLIGYIGGLLFWPYGLLGPIDHVRTALKEMAHFDTNIRLLFNGKSMMSNEVPWNYIPTWLWITTPLVILYSAIAQLPLMVINRKIFKREYSLLLLFATLFPWAYAVYGKSALYDGMRHFLFVIPMIAVVAALTWDTFFSITKNKIIHGGAALFMAGGLMLPLSFCVTNHPNEYVYFNQHIGGIKGAYGNFDTDYYQNSIKQACVWAHENIKPVDGKKIIIATNTADPVSWSFKNDTAHFKIIYTRYYGRTEKKWDYGIFYSRPIDRTQLMNKSWPGSNTIYSVTAGGVPLCNIVHRTNTDDFAAKDSMQAGKFIAAVHLYKNALAADNSNEEICTKLAQAYMALNKPDSAAIIAQQSLKLYPLSPQALDILCNAFFGVGEFEKAINACSDFLRNDNTADEAYMNMGLAYAYMKNYDQAFYNLNIATQLNPGNWQAYQIIGAIYQQKGDAQTAQQYFNQASAVKQQLGQ